MRTMYGEDKKRQTPFTTSTTTTTNDFIFFWTKVFLFLGYSNSTAWFQHPVSHCLASGVSGRAWRQWIFEQGVSPEALSLLTPNCLAWAVKHRLAQLGRARQQETTALPLWMDTELLLKHYISKVSAVPWEIMVELQKVFMPLLLCGDSNNV